MENRARRSRVDALARHRFAAEECVALEALGASVWSTLAGIRLTGAGTDDPRLERSGAAACSAPLAWWHFDQGHDYSLALVQLAGTRGVHAQRAPAGTIDHHAERRVRARRAVPQPCPHRVPVGERAIP